MNLPPACNPSACRASGRGLQPKGLRVKEVADLKVYTKGSGSGELKVAVKGPSKKHHTNGSMSHFSLLSGPSSA